MKNEGEIAERRLSERKKIKSKKEKTLQQQKGLPTLSVALNNNNNEEGTAESVKGQRAVAPLTLINSI